MPPRIPLLLAAAAAVDPGRNRADVGFAQTPSPGRHHAEAGVRDGLAAAEACRRLLQETAGTMGLPNELDGLVRRLAAPPKALGIDAIRQDMIT